jgi:3-oxoacyl-[acyl-carrier protein] reductase
MEFARMKRYQGIRQRARNRTKARPMDLDLKGKRALVTGGTRGIGRAIVETLASEGAHVALCARKPAEVEAAVATLTKNGHRAVGQAADVSKPDALRAWVESSAKALGGIDILVANASALASGADETAFRKAFETDLLHTVNLVEFGRSWIEKSTSGSIVAISSVSGVEDYGFGDAAYGAMKAALLFYMKSLARELAPRGIRANVVSPGTTLFEDGYWGGVQRDQPAAFAEAIASNPTGHMATPADIARAVAFVASPAAGFVTGINFVVDGTLTRRIQN